MSACTPVMVHTCRWARSKSLRWNWVTLRAHDFSVNTNRDRLERGKVKECRRDELRGSVNKDDLCFCLPFQDMLKINLCNKKEEILNTTGALGNWIHSHRRIPHHSKKIYSTKLISQHALVIRSKRSTFQFSPSISNTLHTHTHIQAVTLPYSLLPFIPPQILPLIYSPFSTPSLLPLFLPFPTLPS